LLARRFAAPSIRSNRARAELRLTGCSFFIDCQPPFTMRVHAGQAGAQLTLLAWFRAAGRATNRQRFLRFDLHGYTLHDLASKFWSIMTSTQTGFVEY
jgi:hypothetical protein